MTDLPVELEPVRVELTQAQTFGFVTDDDGGRHGDTKTVHVALIHPVVNGRTSRKPAARLTADTRAEVLRLLADWIDRHDDPNLAKLIAAGDLTN